MTTKTATWTESRGSRNVLVVMTTKAVLRHITGNSLPSFSVTADIHEGRRHVGGGACHDLILKHHPELADFVELHLSDMDGTPIHAEANGWHWLAKAAGIDRRWQPDQSPEECLEIFMRHCRIGRQQAEACVIEVKDGGRKVWGQILEDMVPRWNREAKACIAKYKLEVTGDQWPPTPKIIEELMPEIAE
jgi:hypothetical protein